MYDGYSQLGDLMLIHREPGGAVRPGWVTYYSMSSFLLLSAAPLQCFGSCQGRSRSDVRRVLALQGVFRNGRCGRGGNIHLDWPP